MKKTMYSNNRERFSLVFLFLMCIATFTAAAQNKNDNRKVGVYHISNYFSEAYLIKGNSEKLILIDTGVPVAGYQDSLVNSIKKLGFKPENITLAIVTHGHGDHAGNARFLQQTFKTKIAGSRADLEKFTSGKTELQKSEDVSIWGNRLRPYSDLSYPPFTPDIIVDTTIDLAPYGIIGKIIPIKGGHTPGDLLVLIGENLFVGDAFVGTFKSQGGGLAPDGHHVREHFFHENKQLADQNLKVIEKIALENKVKTIYPTHNGPVTTYELSKYIKEEPLLKLLSKQENDLLSAVLNGKSEVANSFLAANFILQTADHKDLNKNEFLQSFNPDPKTKTESLTAEDFRIVSSNENTVVLTYIEIIKLEGKDATNVAVTETYFKEKNEWKLGYKKEVN
ncbi:MBL fold metallo-hydrolase [Flavobacterium sp. LC2016-23]|uniref:MBL fold metallo-hydrolase n=1 Tax=Flavobacterium sp. LC2016-23 TaxID=2666330 RepID=UPI0012B15604|nr:MBL fold metallo-hydrolase [Flavobacterium sp. LC2016-23]MRX38964.1 MBL fold metallo-hydrolase [Flavobacterium sp. LC2016-23]